MFTGVCYCTSNIAFEIYYLKYIVNKPVGTYFGAFLANFGAEILDRQIVFSGWFCLASPRITKVSPDRT